MLLKSYPGITTVFSPITLSEAFSTRTVSVSGVLGIVHSSQLPSVLLPPYCFHLLVHPCLICHNFMLTYCSKTIAAALSEECKQGSVISSPFLPIPLPAGMDFTGNEGTIATKKWLRSARAEGWQMIPCHSDLCLATAVYSQAKCSPVQVCVCLCSQLWDANGIPLIIRREDMSSFIKNPSSGVPHSLNPSIPCMPLLLRGWKKRKAQCYWLLISGIIYFREELRQERKWTWLDSHLQ